MEKQDEESIARHSTCKSSDTLSNSNFTMHVHNHSGEL